ncbi:MAG: hypothetical protein K2Y51_26170 [Gammaproteobacteria bacterium]|nr:hypothetical protein [Gammaproteobacteria bacterium]
MSAADFDPIILGMRRRLHLINTAAFLDPKEKSLLRLIVLRDTLIEWADDGLRTGQQLDCITTTARDLQ